MSTQEFRETRGRSGVGAGVALGVVIAALVFALALALAALFEVFPFGGQEPGPGPVGQIQDLEQLTTARWIGQVVVTEEAEPGRVQSLAERFGVDTSAFTGESVIVVAEGQVEAGVDLADLREDDVRVDGESVTIDLPDPEIFGTSLNEDGTGVYDRDRGFFVFGVDDEITDEARREAADRIEAAAERSDILAQAETNAEEIVRTLVLALDFESVEFE